MVKVTSGHFLMYSTTIVIFMFQLAFCYSLYKLAYISVCLQNHSLLLLFTQKPRFLPRQGSLHERNVNFICKTAFLEVCCIATIQHRLAVDATKTLVVLSILSQTDFFMRFFFSPPPPPFLPLPSTVVGYSRCRNEWPPWWEPRAIKGSFVLSLSVLGCNTALDVVPAYTGFLHLPSFCLPSSFSHPDMTFMVDWL